MSNQGQPLPVAFVSRDYDHTVIGNYMKKKFLALSHAIGKPETCALYYSIEDFKDLMGRIAAQPGALGFRVYFANWCPTGIPSIDAIVNAGYKDLLTLIYSAVDTNGMDLGAYYGVHPTGGVIETPTTAAQAMFNAFKSTKLPLLQEIGYAAGRPEFMETNTLHYTLDKFNGEFGLLGEMDAQQATGMTAFIGAYARQATKTDAAGAQHGIGWQLTVIFEFAKKITFNGSDHIYHFDLEDTGGFNTRPPAPGSEPPEPPAFLKPAGVRPKLDGIDTANPCPPPKPCPGGLG